MPRILLLAIVVMLLAPALSSSSVTVIKPEDVLKAGKVKLKKPDLLEALKKPGLRWAAAAVLSKKGYKDVLPAVKEALRVETSDNDRMGIAVAIAHLGDDEGVQELRRLCGSSNSHVRVNAAELALSLGDEGCFEDVVSVIRTDESATQSYAVRVLAKFSRARTSDRRAAVEVLTQVLNKGPSVYAAAEALLELRACEAVLPLEAASQREQVPVLQSWLKVWLQELRSSCDEPTLGR